MTGYPLVSILIPSFNRPSLIQIALDSALKQTYPNIEIIICDDSTNNEVEEVLKPYLEEYTKIKYYKNNPRLFDVKNKRKLFDLSSGEYINYLMDDDIFDENKISKMMEYFLNHEEIYLVTSSREIIDENGSVQPRYACNAKLFNDTQILDGKVLGNYVLSNVTNVIGEPTTVLFRKKDLVGDFGIYQGKEYIGINDLAAWLTLLSKGRAVYIPETLSYFRIHPAQVSQDVPDVGSRRGEWIDIIVDSRKDGFLAEERLFHNALINYRYTIMDVLNTSPPDTREKLLEDLEFIKSIIDD